LRRSFVQTDLSEAVSALRGQYFDDFVFVSIQMTEYLFDHHRVFYARYNFNRTTAWLTGLYFYPKNPFKFLRPGHRLVLL
jgi:hypothetical protein